MKQPAKAVKAVWTIPSQMPKHARFSIKTDLNNLTQVLNWFDQMYSTQIPQQTWLECKIALAEGFTNAVRHAHQALPAQTPIQLGLGINLRYIEIQIWDHGPPFDLQQYLRWHPTVPDLAFEHGRGLLLLHQIADTLHYRRVDHCHNCLSIIKYLTQSQ